jgi:exodeoxyribonuclease-3
VPNSQAELARLHERIAFEGIMREYLKKLEAYECPVIYAGDLNIAPTAKDIHNPIGNAKSAGFSIQEREQFQLLLDCGFVDSFRHLYPDHVAYSYFSNMRNSRLNNKGWRIDLILVSKGYEDQIKGADVLGDYHGSDHCPVLLDFDA